MPDDPLDLLTQTVKALVQRGKAQGYILRPEFDAAFADLAVSAGIEIDPGLIEDTAAVLLDLGVEIVDEP